MDGGFCTACGAQVPEGSSFCGVCGIRVQAVAPAGPAVAPPPLVTTGVATPAEAAIPVQPPAAPPAATPPAPPAITPPPQALPAYAPPPAPAGNPPWGKILSVLVGLGFLIFGGIKLYNAFYGAPSSSAAVRQMEDKIRQDFQARGQQVSQVQLTAENSDRMTGSVMVGNATIPGSGLRYDCTATRQSGSYFTYQCAPASGSSTSMPTPSSMAPMGASGSSASTGLTAITPAQRAEAIAECTDEERRQVADPASFCTCAIDRLAAGISRGQAVSECATRLGIPVPRD